MSGPFEHLLLTRFNVGLPWTGMEADEEWLRHRIKLFEAFCYPSVVAQTRRSFRWIIFLDADSPDFLRNRVEEYRRWPNLVPLYTGRFSSQVSRKAVSRHLGRGTGWVITSRLDNDDALHRDYIRMVQESFTRRGRYWINFPNGYILAKKGLFRASIQCNQFISMVEKFDYRKEKGPLTVFCGLSHMRSMEVAPVTDIDAGPGWLRVLHGRNASPGSRARRHLTGENEEATDCLARDFGVDMEAVREVIEREDVE